MFRLGVAYRDGLGVRRLQRLAKYWFQKGNVDGDHEDAAAALEGLEQRVRLKKANHANHSSHGRN